MRGKRACVVSMLATPLLTIELKQKRTPPEPRDPSIAPGPSGSRCCSRGPAEPKEKSASAVDLAAPSARGR